MGGTTLAQAPGASRQRHAEWRLPSPDYLRSGENTVSFIRHAAKVAAADMARKYAVIVKVMPRLASQVAIIGPVLPRTPQPEPPAWLPHVAPVTPDTCESWAGTQPREGPSLRATPGHTPTGDVTLRLVGACREAETSRPSGP